MQMQVNSLASTWPKPHGAISREPPLGAGYQGYCFHNAFALFCQFRLRHGRNNTTTNNSSSTRQGKPTAGMFTHFPRSTDHSQTVGKSVGLDWTGTYELVARTSTLSDPGHRFLIPVVRIGSLAYPRNRDPLKAAVKSTGIVSSPLTECGFPLQVKRKCRIQ